MNTITSSEDNKHNNCPEIKTTAKLSLDIRITDFLSNAQGNKYSRADAFVDIIQMIQRNVAEKMKALSAIDSKETKNAGDSNPSASDSATEQCVETNCSQLAKRWHWNRITVSKFLAELEQLGILLCIRQGHSIIIYI